jgi:hypothetical protein
MDALFDYISTRYAHFIKLLTPQRYIQLLCEIGEHRITDALGMTAIRHTVIQLYKVVTMINRLDSDPSAIVDDCIDASLMRPLFIEPADTNANTYDRYAEAAMDAMLKTWLYYYETQKLGNANASRAPTPWQEYAQRNSVSLATILISLATELVMPGEFTKDHTHMLTMKAMSTMHDMSIEHTNPAGQTVRTSLWRSALQLHVVRTLMPALESYLFERWPSASASFQQKLKHIETQPSVVRYDFLCAHAVISLQIIVVGQVSTVLAQTLHQFYEQLIDVTALMRLHWTIADIGDQFKTLSCNADKQLSNNNNITKPAQFDVAPYFAQHMPWLFVYIQDRNHQSSIEAITMQLTIRSLRYERDFYQKQLLQRQAQNIVSTASLASATSSSSVNDLLMADYACEVPVASTQRNTSLPVQQSHSTPTANCNPLTQVCTPIETRAITAIDLLTRAATTPNINELLAKEIDAINMMIANGDVMTPSTFAVCNRLFDVTSTSVHCLADDVCRALRKFEDLILDAWLECENYNNNMIGARKKQNSLST